MSKLTLIETVADLHSALANIENPVFAFPGENATADREYVIENLPNIEWMLERGHLVLDLVTGWADALSES